MLDHNHSPTHTINVLLCIYMTDLWYILFFSESYGVVDGQNTYVWPLGVDAMNIEVNGFGQVPSNSIGDVTVKTGPTALGYDSFAFKGSPASYIELRVPATTPLDGDFTFLFYLFLESNTGGLLLSFESDDVNATDTLTGITVTFDSSKIKVLFSGQAASWPGGTGQVDNEIATGMLSSTRVITQTSPCNILQYFKALRL